MILAVILLVIGYDHSVTVTEYPIEAACLDAAWSVDRGGWSYWVCR